MSENMRKELDDAIRAFNVPPVAYNPVYADIVGSVVGAILLQKLLNLHAAFGEGFFFQRDKLMEELRFSRREFDAGMAAIKGKGIFTVEKRGLPAKNHYTLDTWRLWTLIGKNVPTSGYDGVPTGGNDGVPTGGYDSYPQNKDQELRTKQEVVGASHPPKLSLVELPKRFAPPALEDVKAYATELEAPWTAGPFCDYYTSNGWKVGKNPMKDWRASLRRWVREDKKREAEKDNRARGYR